ncbi:hypothetical protein CCR75_009465 [Bremia lactucae]|uniref:Uncharacterized protein n=1 Tax=Bremia lactucae TaxID=4779 RepID=A0A976FMX0_BRELC|nr:hypothetical protein CCR75_009466 [Bremia lactucae]TDH69462.1 hypothetical protein CCR75_009465 [Bremia lactucae]
MTISSERRKSGSPQSREWLTGVEQKVQAMHENGMLLEVPKITVPEKKRMIRTMWRVQVNPDTGEQVSSFCPRS